MATKKRYRRQRIGDPPRTEVPKPPSFPTIMGSPCDGVSKDDGIHYSWRAGPTRVDIEPSYDSDKDKHDYRCSIWFFYGDPDTDVGEPVLQVWRATAKLCAKYADHKLTRLFNMLGDSLEPPIRRAFQGDE